MTNNKRKLDRRLFLRLAGGALGGAAWGCSRQGASPAAREAEAPLYVDGGLGWPVLRGPYLQRDARIAAFLLQSSSRQLEQLCDRYLNAPSGGKLEYKPLTSYVLMLLADMAVSSLDERDRELGWLRETEVSFWIVTVARARAGGLIVPDHLAWFLPYIFLDNPQAIAAGREVYGLPKMLARFEQPAAPGRPEFAMDVWGLERLGTEARLQRLLQVRQKEAGEAQARPWSSWDEARAALVRLLLRDADISSLGEILDEQNLQVPLVFLKQFRDAADTRRACYQALVEAPARVQQFHGGGTLEGTYELVFSPLTSHPLAQSLGLAVDERGALQALAHFWLHLDFTLELGQEVWRAEA